MSSEQQESCWPCLACTEVDGRAYCGGSGDGPCVDGGRSGRSWPPSDGRWCGICRSLTDHYADQHHVVFAARREAAREAVARLCYLNWGGGLDWSELHDGIRDVWRDRSIELLSRPEVRTWAGELL